MQLLNFTVPPRKMMLAQLITIMSMEVSSSRVTTLFNHLWKSSWMKNTSNSKELLLKIHSIFLLLLLQQLAVLRGSLNNGQNTKSSKLCFRARKPSEKQYIKRSTGRSHLLTIKVGEAAINAKMKNTQFSLSLRAKARHLVSATLLWCLWRGAQTNFFRLHPRKRIGWCLLWDPQWYKIKMADSYLIRSTRPIENNRYFTRLRLLYCPQVKTGDNPGDNWFHHKQSFKMCSSL